MLRTVLIVDPDERVATRLKAALEGVADARACHDFTTARTLLFGTPPDLLVSNLRLQSHNGLHLVHLAATAGLTTRALIYTDRPDAALASEAREAGAFVEQLDTLPETLPAYAHANLPQLDRRTAGSADRRQVFRGGRRAADAARVEGTAAHAPAKRI